ERRGRDHRQGDRHRGAHRPCGTSRVSSLRRWRETAAPDHPAGLDTVETRQRYPARLRHAVPTAGERGPPVSLAALYQDVRGYLAAREATAQTVVAFGDREVAKQINQGTGRANRVVVAPGDDGGNLGGYGPPAKIGRNPRHLWEWQLTARVYVWAYDPAAPN